MISWPEDLIRDIASRRCVLFLGAGVSKNAATAQGAHPPDWSEFLSILANEIEDVELKAEVLTCIAEGDLLTACELSRRVLKNDGFKSVLLREYFDKQYLPAPIHRDLSRIDSRLVLTTNFDRIYEHCANAMQNGTVLVKSYYDSDVADVFRRPQRVVLKVHGTIDLAERTIFTRSQYASARRDHPYFYQVLRALFVTHTHIFLGASLKDPDIQLLLEDHAFRFEGTRPHFIAMPYNAARQGILKVMEETMNLRALLYDPADSHKALADSVASLVPLVESARAELAITNNW